MLFFNALHLTGFKNLSGVKEIKALMSLNFLMV